jgi:ribosomal protein S18 acetylase RimI-like enzyme
LITSRETIDRVIAADVAYTIARMRVLERLSGNPVGIAWRQVDDHITALMAKHLPSPSFNRVVGLRAGDERHIAPLDAWYREAGAATRFEMIPGHFDAALGRELARLGYAHSAFHAALICPPALDPAEHEEVDVEAVTTAAQMEDFLRAYVAGWGLPAKDHERFKANVRPWLGLPGWSLYLARQDGQPAAAAALFLHGAVGYLADACTDPAFRRRGLHTALLRRRIADARQAGADLVFSGAEFLSGSYRDMQRIGLQLLFMRAIWTPLPGPA